LNRYKGTSVTFYRGIFESKRTAFTPHELAHCWANKNSSWEWSPPKGRGGIFVGVNFEKFNDQNIVLGNFHLKFNIKNKVDNFD
jgi:hypothetical protein